VFGEYVGDNVKPWDMLNPNEKRSSEEEFERRLSICRECPFFIKRTQQCKKCGCFMNLKVKLERSSCPIKKW
jgi:hypothetical protein